VDAALKGRKTPKEFNWFPGPINGGGERILVGFGSSLRGQEGFLSLVEAGFGRPLGSLRVSIGVQAVPMNLPLENGLIVPEERLHRQSPTVT